MHLAYLNILVYTTIISALIQLDQMSGVEGAESSHLTVPPGSTELFSIFKLIVLFSQDTIFVGSFVHSRVPHERHLQQAAVTKSLLDLTLISWPETLLQMSAIDV